MTLKLRGRTQFLDNSIGLQKLVTISSGKIIGRSLADSGDGPLKELSVSETRTNLGLNTDSTGVSFGDISGADLDMQGKTLTLTGLTTDSGISLDDDSISGNKIHGGNISGGYGSVTFTEEYTWESFDQYDESYFTHDNSAQYFGRTVDLSSSNDVLIVGGKTNNAGSSALNPNVFRYEYNSSTSEWDVSGHVFVRDNRTQSESHDAGRSIATNHDGSILVYGWGNWRNRQSTSQGRSGALYVFYWDSNDSEYKLWNHNSYELQDLTTNAAGQIYLTDTSPPSRNYNGVQMPADYGDAWNGSFWSTGAPKCFGQCVSINGDGDKMIVSSHGKSDESTEGYTYAQFGEGILNGTSEGFGYIHTYFWVDKGGSSVGYIDSVSDTTGLNYPDTLAVDTTPTYDYTGYYEFEHIRVSAPTNSKGFGFSCSISKDGSKMVVGAPMTTVDSNDYAGTVYTYDWNSTNNEWDIRTQVLQLDSPSEDDQFGVEVEISPDGKRLAVGQAGYWDAVWGKINEQQGAVYLYDLNETTGNWDLNQTVTDSNGSSTDNFGLGLAFNSTGQKIFIGVPGKDNTSYSTTADTEGAVYEYGTEATGSKMLTFSGSEVTISNALVHTGTGDSTLKSGNVDINGGNIDGTIIGSNSSTEGTFTDLTAIGTGSSSLNNVVIGNNTASSGAFTTLDSTSLSVGSSDELSVSNAGVLTTSGTISSTDASGTSSFSGNFTVGGNLTVSGSTITVDTENLIVEDTLAKFGDGNSGDLKDLGFFGEYVNNSSETKYAGIFRDVSDGEFKLFSDFGTEPSVNVVGDVSGSLGTLHANITGDVTGDLTGNANTTTEFETNRSFTVSGDVSTSMSHNFKGTQDVNLVVSMNNNVADFANIHDDVVVTSTEDLSNFDSDVMIVTASAVIDYVEENLLRGGSSATLESTSIKMLDSNSEFVRVKKHFQRSLIDADDVINGYVSISTDLESDFSGLAEVFLNGQKIASGTSAQVAAGTKDYYFDTSSSNNHKIYMDSDFIKSGDKLEIIYYILAT